ncbi:unnamed protein product [[Candida] boidinii]|uniref:Unnamed protein product n=1 Tax=Candida boidinii TaxID=5477 RepID=A0ACB5TF22_CANBO|nr:unnamed protein product [[Candida] boidinii]
MVQSIIDSTIEIVKRHGSHHHINEKYGYIIFGLSVLFLIVRYTSLTLYEKAWKNSRRSTTRLKLVQIPLFYNIAIITSITILILFFNLHVTEFKIHVKRAGRLSYCLIPLDLVLSFRPAILPIDNYLDTLKLHKWVSRLMLLLATFHSIGYLTIWATADEYEKLFRPLNFLGFFVFIFTTVLFVVNWKPVRNLAYNVFYLFHNITVIVFVFLIAIHARPGVFPYTFLNFILLLSQLVVKLKSIKTSVTIKDIISNDNSDLKIVKISKEHLPENFNSASHLRLSYNIGTLSFWIFPSHPYTIASNDNSINNMDSDNNDTFSLIIRETKFKVNLGDYYSIQSIFKSSLSPNFFNTADNIVIVCGGSGISFGLPVYNYFRYKNSNENKDYKIKLIWLTSNKNNLFILDALKIKGIEVFITNESNGSTSTSSGFSSLNNYEIDDSNNVELQDLSNPFNEEQETGNDNEDDDHFDLGSLEDSNNSKTNNSNYSINQNKIHIGKRPNLENIISKNLDQTIDYANKWILSCGPQSLNNNCESIAYELNSRFFCETYAM